MPDFSAAFIKTIESMRGKENLTMQELAVRMGYDNSGVISKKMNRKLGISLNDIDIFSKALGITSFDLISEVLRVLSRDMLNEFNANNFYTYENLQLDPSACVFSGDQPDIIDALSDYKPNIIKAASIDIYSPLPEIEFIIDEYFKKNYEKAGNRQIYVARTLSGSPIIGYGKNLFEMDDTADKRPIFHGLSQDYLSPNEVIATIKDIKKEIGYPIIACGIFLEIEPERWKLVR